MFTLRKAREIFLDTPYTRGRDSGCVTVLAAPWLQGINTYNVHFNTLKSQLEPSEDPKTDGVWRNYKVQIIVC